MKHQTKLNNKSPIERIILLSFPILFSITLLSALILLNSHANAEEPLTDTKSATVSVNVPSACTMTSSGEDSHTDTVMPGVFTGDIGTTTITTKCNNHPGGYAIYAIGYSDSTYGNTNLLHSTDTSTTIPTGTGTSNSNWSMKLAPGTGTESTDIVDTYRDYAAVPSSYTKVVNKNSATSPTTGSTVTTTYGTYITPNQQIGTYTGRVKYIMVNPSTADTPIIYQISYDKNTTDEVTNMPDPNPEASESTTEVAIISTNVPVREGYNFKGWCSVETSDETCSGTVYNPDGGGTNLNIPLDSAGTNNFTLHAMWELGILYMQNVATWGKTLTTGEEVTAVDSRDNKEYTVVKLNDGNIWMNQNLDFDIDSNKTYTSADTDIKADWKPSTSTTTGTSWRDTRIAPLSYDPGDLCWKGTPSDSYYGSLSDYAQPCTTAGSNLHYHLGNYYNWTAAVAMNDSGSYTSQNTDVDQSICPAGWMLPKSGTTQTGSGSFQYLVNQQGLTSGTSGNIHTSPAYFVYGGYWIGGLFAFSYAGFYWSSVVYTDNFAYSMLFNSSGGLAPQNTDGRGGTYSVRCVARPSA